MIRRSTFSAGFAVFAGAALGLASCGDQAGTFVPSGGGSGAVIETRPDAGGDGRDAAGTDTKIDIRVDVRADLGSGGAAGGRDGAAGTTAGAAGTGGGAAGATSGAAGTASGAAGTGPQEDPCTACERARCGNPRGAAANPGQYDLAIAAFSMCFSGTGFPEAFDKSIYCPADSDPGAVAVSGPARGKTKASLCRALVDCVHKNHCSDLECYCGVGVSSNACLNPSFTPTGPCKAEIENATESTEIGGEGGIAAHYYDACMATASAFEIIGGCDYNCCAAECGSPPSASGIPPDPIYCNAATSGAAGTSGSAGTSAAVGTSGAAGTSAAAGTNGAAGTSAAAGTSGAAGSSAAAGTSGAAGTTAPPAAMLLNPRFDVDTSSWSTSYLASMSRSPNDAGGSVQSGSLDVKLMGGAATIPTEAEAWQCIGVTAGATYDVGAKVLVPGQTASKGSVGLWTYSSSDCSGTLTGVFASPSSGAATWQSVMASTQIAAGIKSARVRLTVYKPIGQTAGEVLFDDVVFVRR